MQQKLQYKNVILCFVINVIIIIINIVEVNRNAGSISFYHSCAN